ncbi:MAG: hypothetical protein Q9181_005779 [Wetmoreana brouardii]
MFEGISYDAANNIAKVGAGQRWGDVYNQLDAHNVTVVGGRVVLANGSIVHANAKSNADLWWALKGGGNNFGEDLQFEKDKSFLMRVRNCNFVHSIYVSYSRGLGWQ